MSFDSQEDIATNFINSLTPAQRSMLLSQPRQPRSFQGLLRFAMEATQAEDGPGPSHLGPMDEDRKKFLEQVLKSMTIDIAEVLQGAIALLSNEKVINTLKCKEKLPEGASEKLDLIMQYVDDIDVANDFKQIGGFSIFPVCLGCDHDEIRSKASSIIGTVCQNNPPCQAKAVECGLLNLLIHLANTELDANPNSALFGKYLYGISGIVRGFPRAIKLFVEQDGVYLLMKGLNSPNMSVKTRSAFLVQHLCHNPNVKEYLVKQNVVKMAVEEINAGQTEATEHLLSMLQSLLETRDPNIIEQCIHMKLNFKTVIENHLALVEKDDSYMEEKEYCRNILKLFKNFSHSDLKEEVDR